MIYPRPIGWNEPRGRIRPRSVAPERQPWSRKRIVKTAVAGTVLFLLSLIALAGLVLTVTMIRVRPTLPSITAIAAFQPTVATTVYSSDGVLLAKLQMENRQVVPLKSVSKSLIDATLAVEDSRFYQHSGVDMRGVARALVANVVSRDATSQGASTITQQLARNVSQFGLGKEKSFTRKVREAMTAVRIEQVFSKDEILELYLNQIYYGSGAYGVEAASRTYFGKPSAKLSLPEAALLAGLPQRPVAYSPYINLQAAKDRRDVVLRRMLDTGRITSAEYEAARQEAIKLSGRKSNNTVYRAPYFVDWVVQDLERKYGVDAIYSGWKIVTTLDWRMQESAEKSLRRGLAYGATQGALVSIDPHSGEVRAMVGGVDYQRDRFNAVTQGKRQPGSAFKPIVYAAAFDTGTVGLDSKIKDEPLTIPNGSKSWTVHNYGGGYSNEEVTVLDAIKRSINTVAVETAQEVGVSRVIEYGHRLGITTDLAPYLPLALGASAVRPIELCAAYGVFAAGGEHYQPIGIQSVTDGAGNVIEQPSAEDRRRACLLQPGAVEQINVALHAVVQEGTGAAARSVPNAFGKTGTTSDHRDAWFVGYTPELVTAVWVARPSRTAKGMRYEVMPGATGGHVAAPIWARYMTAAVPIQKRVNQVRHRQAWAISLPQPVTIGEDDEVTQSEEQREREASLADLGLPTNRPFPGELEEQRRTGIQWGAEVTRAAHISQPAVSGSERVVIYSPDRSSDDTGRDRPERAAAVSNAGTNTARICADSGQLATEWCEATYMVDFGRRTAPTRTCRLHHAPAGE